MTKASRHGLAPKLPSKRARITFEDNEVTSGDKYGGTRTIESWNSVVLGRTERPRAKPGQAAFVPRRRWGASARRHSQCARSDGVQKTAFVASGRTPRVDVRVSVFASACLRMVWCGVCAARELSASCLLPPSSLVCIASGSLHRSLMGKCTAVVRLFFPGVVLSLSEPERQSSAPPPWRVAFD